VAVRDELGRNGVGERVNEGFELVFGVERFDGGEGGRAVPEAPPAAEVRIDALGRELVEVAGELGAVAVVV